MSIYQIPETNLEIERENQILEWNGITKEEGKRKPKRKYRFYVYQLELVAAFMTYQVTMNGQPWFNSSHKKNEKWKRISTNTATREVSKAKKLAIRSLFVLGNDLGMVEVAAFSSAPKFAVTYITNKQVTAESFKPHLDKVVKRLEKKENNMNGKEPVLGADVECVLRHTSGKYVLASRYFSKKGKIGYDAIWLKGNRNKHPLVEFRPSPSKNPKDIYVQLYRSMKTGVSIVNNPKIEWLAGGKPLKGYPIGGHIHFSQVHLESQLIRALDNYITLPLSLMESKESLSRRPKYGFLGDYREQFHGGFEYRTPPSWIVTPTITRGVLAIAKVVSSDYKMLNWLPLNGYEVQKDFYQGNREALYSTAKTLWEHLKGCPSYKENQKDIDSFFQLLDQGFVWKEYQDIRKAWRLPPYR
jgi:hypothetical protein